LQLGFVIQNLITPDDLYTLHQARPGILVFVAPLPGAEAVRTLRLMFPDCLFIYRERWSQEEQHAFLRDPDGARKAADRAFFKLNEHGTADCFDLMYGLNEAVGPQERDAWDAYRLLDTFQVNFLAECRRRGKDAIAFNTASGVLSYDEVKTYFPKTVATHTYFGLHVYDWPCLDSKDRNWYALRHRFLKTLDALPDNAQVLVTELGLTHAIYGGSDVGMIGGEKDGKIWPGIPLEEYKRTIGWWVNDVRAHDKKITHAALFLLNSPYKEWQSFVHTGSGEWVGTLNTFVYAPTPHPMDLQDPSDLPEGGTVKTFVNILNERFGDRWYDLRYALPTGPGVYAKRALSGVKYFAVHHVGADPVPGQNLKDLCIATARYHAKTKGWPGIGYHFVIHMDGTLGYVGDIDTMRANVANMNDVVIGVCLQGNLVGDRKPTAAQLSTLWSLYCGVQELNPKIAIVPHKKLNATVCPGGWYDSWVPSPAVDESKAWTLNVGEGIKNFLRNRQDRKWGVPRQNAHWDGAGNEYCWTTTSNLVYWDRATNHISVLDRVA
jgi:hypothetical protein